jgi:hypothetical protein
MLFSGHHVRLPTADARRRQPGRSFDSKSGQSRATPASGDVQLALRTLAFRARPPLPRPFSWPVRSSSSQLRNSRHILFHLPRVGPAGSEFPAKKADHFPAKEG